MADKPIAVESKPQFPMCNVRLTFLPLATMAGLFLAGCEGAPRTADTAGLEGGTASAEAPAGAQAYRASSSDFGSHLSDGSSPATVPPVQDPDPTSQVTASRTTAIVRAARTVAPAVVTIAVRRRERVRRRSFFDPYYLPFRETQGLGSGFNRHGTVLTNHHVVRPKSSSPSPTRATSTPAWPDRILPPTSPFSCCRTPRTCRWSR